MARANGAVDRSRSEWIGGKRAVAEAVNAGQISEVLVAANSRSTPGMRDLLLAAKASGVAIREVSRAELDRVTTNHGGVAARVRGGSRSLTERDLSTFGFGAEDLIVVLDGITDPQNLGAAARSAEAAGAVMLVMRVHRAAAVTPAAIRASAGALSHLRVARVANISRALDRLRDLGFTTVGLAQEAPRSVFDEPAPGGRLALVVGSEGAGLSRLVRERCDALVSLPMKGKVGSLNASAALAAALYSFVLPGRRPVASG